MPSPPYPFFFLLFLIFLLSCSDEEKIQKNTQREVLISSVELNRNSKVKIAVVGAGIGGASYSHFITQSLGDQVDITVYEKSEQIGGRVRKSSLGGGLIEQGATLIHSSNHYLQHIMNVHQLKPTIPHGGEGEAETLAIWDGKKFRLNTSRNKTISSLQMLWAYGNSITDLQAVVKNALPKWNSIYDLLDKGQGFHTPTELFKTIGLYDMTQKTSYDYFKEEGIDKKIVHEFVDCISRVNYHQDGNINAFTDIVSLAGAGLDGGELFSVEGGNDLIIKSALSNHNIDILVENEVTSIKKLSNTGRIAHVITTNTGSIDTFEIVVIACPLDLTNIQLPQYPILRNRAYQNVHANFIAGHINYEYFNDVSNEPQTIFTIEDDNIPFVSIAKTGYAPEWELPIYKVFSREPLDKQFFNSIFSEIKGQVHQEWKAYPVLTPMKRWPSFRLDDGLFYINAMESAVSAMETEAVAARNVLNLTIAQLIKNPDQEN